MKTPAFKMTPRNFIIAYNVSMKQFIRQLRDRHVVKVAIAYLVFAWVVLQLADVILPALQLPEWSMTLTLGLLAAGFPVALILSWIFDLTSDGIKRTDDDGLDPKPEALPGSAPAITLSDRSIAVLPFPDLSAEQDQEHFCDGLTEELLNVLTRIPNLRVASRTSSFAVKGQFADLNEMANKLNVAHILEGSVRKSGNRVRITAKLTQVASDSNLWSETYDRELSDIFAIQDDIAKRILDVLKIKLSEKCLPDPTTKSATAYEYFLRGRGYAMSRSVLGIERAIELFQQAIATDPGFVRAWIELAENSSMQTIFYGGGEDSCNVACDAADEAMRLAPDRSESFMARGFGHLAAHRYADAETDFQRALEIDHTQVRAHYYMGRSAHLQGAADRSLRHFVRSTELDPEDWESPTISLGNFRLTGDAAGAEKMARTGLDRIERHLRDYPDNPRAYYLGSGAWEVLGDMDKAKEWAEKAMQLNPEDLATRYNTACFYARTGEADKALDLLENSIQSRSWIINDADLASLRNHPRYQAVIDSLPE
jgi:adenylate cyclase